MCRLLSCWTGRAFLASKDESDVQKVREEEE